LEWKERGQRRERRWGSEIYERKARGEKRGELGDKSDEPFLILQFRAYYGWFRHIISTLGKEVSDEGHGVSANPMSKD